MVFLLLGIGFSSLNVPFFKTPIPLIWFGVIYIFVGGSCFSALVFSIPLGYFDGIGAGFKNRILFKGSNFLDLMTKVDIVVMDKTGTLTKGIFEVQEVVTYKIDVNFLLKLTFPRRN